MTTVAGASLGIAFQHVETADGTTQMHRTMVGIPLRGSIVYVSLKIITRITPTVEHATSMRRWQSSSRPESLPNVHRS